MFNGWTAWEKKIYRGFQLDSVFTWIKSCRIDGTCWASRHILYFRDANGDVGQDHFWLNILPPAVLFVNYFVNVNTFTLFDIIYFLQHLQTNLWRFLMNLISGGKAGLNVWLASQLESRNHIFDPRRLPSLSSANSEQGCLDKIFTWKNINSWTEYIVLRRRSDSYAICPPKVSFSFKPSQTNLLAIFTSKTIKAAVQEFKRH